MSPAINTAPAHCNICGHETRHYLIATKHWREIVDKDGESPPVYIRYIYQFLQCRGCYYVTMRRKTIYPEVLDGEIITEYFPPAVSRRQPTWSTQLPDPILQLLREVYLALHSDSQRLAMIGTRTLVDMAILDKVGDVGNFKQKLQALEDQGFIGKRNREILEAALGAGHAAAHRGQNYKVAEVNQVIDIVENLLQAVYILEKTAAAIKKVTPPRKHNI